MPTATFTTFIHAIAHALGPAWTYTPSLSSYRDQGALSRSTDEMTLAVYTSSGAPDRLVAYANYPTGSPEYRRTNFEASASMGRPPRAVARDIERKIIAPFTPVLAEMKEYIARDKADRRAAVEAAHQVAAALELPESTRRLHDTAATDKDWLRRISHASITVQVPETGPSVEITMSSLSVDEALQVIDVWKSIRDAVRTQEG